MEQQVDTIGIYADSISLQDSADWELKIRKAVIENSAEYKEEQATKQAIAAQIDDTEEETTTTKVAKRRSKKQTDCIIPNCNDWHTFLLIVIAFLLFLNLIFNK